jgi:hypothetical protein
VGLTLRCVFGLLVRIGASNRRRCAALRPLVTPADGGVCLVGERRRGAIERGRAILSASASHAVEDAGIGGFAGLSLRREARLCEIRQLRIVVLGHFALRVGHRTSCQARATRSQARATHAMAYALMQLVPALLFASSIV